MSFIVVNWNTKALAEQCIASIFNSWLKGEFEIILVDNGSTDGSVDYLLSKFSELIVIKNQSNLGFAKANNQGLQVARGEFAVLTNSDVVVNKKAIGVILDFLAQNNDAGVVGCNLINGHTRKIQKFSFGYRPTTLRAINQFLGLFNLSRYIRFFRGINSVSVERGSPFVVDWVSGAYMFVKMSAYRMVGGLKEDYFFYVEDMEWCIRLQNNGWKIYFIPEVSVIHFLGGSQKTHEQRMAMSRNWYENLRSFFMEKHSRTQGFIFDLFALFGFSLRYLVARIKDALTGGDGGFSISSNLAIARAAVAHILKIK